MIMEKDIVRSNLSRAEIISVIGLILSMAIAAGGGLITYGGQNTKIELLQTTIINLNTTVTALNQTLASTREEVASLKAQREGTEKALSDLKSTLDAFIRSQNYR
jgi:outer membrane murein-binding lipoprotein Lpp